MQLAATLLRAPILAVSESDARDNFARISVEWYEWAGLLAFIGVLLLVDILVFHRRAHDVSTKEAAVESAVWISIGVAFSLVIFALYGGAATGEYFAGYLIEKSLSVDNVFVWSIIFTYFAVPGRFQHRVLFWGIFGALVLRAVFIFAGVALIERFAWLLFVFGAFLVFTGVRLVTHDSGEVHPEHNPVLRLVRKVIPSTTEYDGQKLFTHVNAKRVATPLFAVLILIESTDVVFAVDSVPAVLAVSREQFIVFASNAFAILGLRALYFLLADLHARFTYLQQGLAVILVFVGVKMIISEWYHIPTALSLGVIALVLAVAVMASIKKPPADETIDFPVEQPSPPSSSEASSSD